MQMSSLVIVLFAGCLLHCHISLRHAHRARRQRSDSERFDRRDPLFYHAQLGGASQARG